MFAAHYTQVMVGQAELKTLVVHDTQINAGTSEKVDVLIDMVNKLLLSFAPVAPPSQPVNIPKPFSLPLRTVEELTQLNYDLQDNATFNSFVSKLCLETL